MKYPPKGRMATNLGKFSYKVSHLGFGRIINLLRIPLYTRQWDKHFNHLYLLIFSFNTYFCARFYGFLCIDSNKQLFQSKEM